MEKVVYAVGDSINGHGECGIRGEYEKEADAREAYESGVSEEKEIALNFYKKAIEAGEVSESEIETIGSLYYLSKITRSFDEDGDLESEKVEELEWASLDFEDPDIAERDEILRKKGLIE
jgi:hypothetical protein